MAQHLDRAAVLTHQPHENADGRGFTRPVGPDEAEDAALGQFKANVIEEKMRVALPHAIHADREVVHADSLDRLGTMRALSVSSRALRSRETISRSLKPIVAPRRAASSRWPTISSSKISGPEPT